jgi:hypothetical protein
MLGLVRRLEEHVGSSVLNVGALCFMFFLGCMLKFSSEFVCLPLVGCDVPTVI